MTLKNFSAALIAASAILLSANTSFAWHHHGSCGSYGGGSCGSYGGSWGSCGSSGGSWGSGGSCGSCGSYGGGGYAYYGGYYGGGYASSRVIYDGIVADRSSSTTYAAETPAVRTRLTIRVPAEAKLTLAGVETKQSGEVRQFATNRLTASQAWDGYKVVAEMQRNGQMVREERTIKLIGGEAQELSINFDSTKVASN